MHGLFARRVCTCIRRDPEQNTAETEIIEKDSVTYGPARKGFLGTVSEAAMAAR